MMTDQQRAELKALADAATPGPWEVADTDSEGEYGSGDDTRSGFKTFGVCAGNLCIVDALNSDAAEVHEEFDGESLYAWDEVAKRNAAFIAAAREAIPALLADLEEAEAAAVSPYMDGYESAKEEYRPQIISLEAELASVRQQLAEAQALVQLGREALEEGGFTKLNKFLNASPPADALQSAIEQAVAPYKRDAERYQIVKSRAYVGVNPHSKTCLWVLRGVHEVRGCGFDEAIDTLSAKEKSND